MKRKTLHVRNVYLKSLESDEKDAPLEISTRWGVRASDSEDRVGDDGKDKVDKQF